MIPLQGAQDRRGRAMRGSAGLLERDDALRAITHALDLAGRQAGTALLIEGHAGMGKTRLHEAALDLARARGLRIFRAAGAELERNLAFGVAGQVLRSVLAALPHPERARLLSTAPVRVLALAGAGDEPQRRPGAPDLTVAHGLFAIVAQACQHPPALLALDDLQWCDGASLEFVLYLVHRLAELPLAVVMTRRPGTGEAAPEALEHLSADPRVAVHTLAPLGGDAVGELVGEALGAAAGADLSAVCAEVTGGNPFYLRELLIALAELPTDDAAELARHARQLAPDAVIRSLRVRVGRLGPAASALARAVAILGDDVPLRRAAALAGLSATEAAAAADGLAEVAVLLAREPLRFVHPLVRHAIELDVPVSERASRHLEAARLLAREGVEAEHVAAHLLLGRAEGDPWAVDQLRAAAEIALARSAPRSAVRYLERALEEPPTPVARPAAVAELGLAEAAAGLPQAVERLEQAMSQVPEPRRRAELALALGHTLYMQSDYERAAFAYDRGVSELDQPAGVQELALHDELQTGYIATASLVPALHAASAARSAVLLPRAMEGPRSHGQRLLLAQAAVHASLHGEAADRVASLAGQAWDEGGLLAEEGAAGIGWSLVTGALCLSGELEACLEVTDAVVAEARRESLPLAFATASYVRAFPLLWQGEVSAAIAELERARDARRFGWRQFRRIAAGAYSLCLLETGDAERAEAVLTEDDPLEELRDLEDIFRRYVLARIRLVQNQAGEARELALSVGEAAEQAGVRMLGYAPWRELAAEACLVLGEGQRGLELARSAEELARATAVPHAHVRALRVLGICQTGETALRTLRQAVELGEALPPRLETVRALIELGAALRRANRRTAAREPLGRAADLAQRGGARVLFEQARIELGATGARPRREVLLSGPLSLTPSERRIAELAAGGQSNREIAQTLFVTPKTVEYHLRNAYRKLGIERRAQLADALAG